ncbi:MAG: DUF1015 domain-containing protein [Actinobacteria bacterium]|nr:DUF1015 domain-containing protein [Actinomycetota bacterium]
MAEVTPFRGMRYRESIALDEVVAPPYDVIPAAQAAELRERSPHNAVHVDLPVAPGEAAAEAAYARAAATFARWQADGVLVREATPSLYLVDQTYRGPDGRERTRRGFVARLRLADFAERVVHPHERTHAGAKIDRLRLYRATRADLSQIFLLVPDDAAGVEDALAAAADAAPAAAAREARDGDGNLHRIVPLAGPGVERIVALLRERPLYIADGHHRYETALAYRDERRGAGDHSADTLMVYLCSMSDPGLTVFPTHRLVRGVVVPPLSELRERLQPFFEVVGTPLRGLEACRSALDGLATEADPGRVFGLYLPREDVCLVVKSRDPEAQQRLVAAGLSPDAAGLSVTVLHELVFRQVLCMDPAQAEKHIDYANSVPDALAALTGGRYELGAFLNATLVGQVRAIADRGETMPQKSTYFYPKLLTGLVFDPLADC